MKKFIQNQMTNQNMLKINNNKFLYLRNFIAGLWIVFFTLFTSSSIVNATDYNAKVVFNPVYEINKIFYSRAAIFNKAFHYVENQPIECLRLGSDNNTLNTSVFLRCKVENLAKKNVKFICAIAPAVPLTNSSVFCKIVANGTIVFNKNITSNSIDYIVTKPPIDNNGNLNLSFELYYSNTCEKLPIDIILPIVLTLEKKKIKNEKKQPDIFFDKNIWTLKNNVENIKLKNKIFLNYNLKFHGIKLKKLEAHANQPVKLIAVIENNGWGDFVNNKSNSFELSVDNQYCKIDNNSCIKFIPDIPAKSFGIIEWTVHPYKKVNVIKGQVTYNSFNENSNFVTKSEFLIPINPKKKYINEGEFNDEWISSIDKKNKLIIYDWVKKNIKLKFIKSLKGIDCLELSVKNTNSYDVLSLVNHFLTIDVLLPDGKIKKLNFKPKSINFLRKNKSKVLLKGWVFSKETGGIIIKQSFAFLNEEYKVAVETEITAKKSLNISKIYNMDFILNEEDNSKLVIPGSIYKNKFSYNENNKFLYNLFASFTPLNKQLIPLICIDNNCGIFLLSRRRENIKYGNSEWFVKDIGGRFSILNILSSESGAVLKKLKPNETIKNKLIINLFPAKCPLQKALPDITETGILPTPLIDAEKKRLVKKFNSTIILTNNQTSTTNINLDNEKIIAQFALLSLTKKQFKHSDIANEVSQTCISLGEKIKTNDYISLSSPYSYLYDINFLSDKNIITNEANKIINDLCIEYDWAMDENITGRNIINKVGIKKITNDILILINALEINKNDDAITLVRKIIKKLHKIYFFENNNSLLIYTKLAKANIKCFKLSKKSPFLSEATRLLKLSEIFIKKTNKDVSRNIGLAVNYLNDYSPDNTYAGLLSPEATLAFADALYELSAIYPADARKNKRLADLLIQSVEKFYIIQSKANLIPEYWEPNFNYPIGKYNLPIYLWKMFLKQNE